MEILTPGSNYHRYIASYRSEGLKINALLTVPLGNEPESGWPVVVLNHGYIQPHLFQTAERYVLPIDDIASDGYIVFRPDYRGHHRSDGVARRGYGYRDYAVDVLSAIEAIKSFDSADPDRIGMWGHSMGGQITLRSMVVSEDIRAGVIWAGVVAPYPDLIEAWSQSGASLSATAARFPDGWRNLSFAHYGTPEENPDFWEPLSANSYLEELSGPLQLHHGTGDVAVPIEFSRTLFDQVLEAGAAAELYEYPGDNHHLSNSFSQATRRSINFLGRYVKGDAD
ncbi:MAG: alpha/beta hydrolase family protein [Candidatus Methylomirabilales bacterium]